MPHKLLGEESSGVPSLTGAQLTCTRRPRPTMCMDRRGSMEDEYNGSHSHFSSSDGEHLAMSGSAAMGDGLFRPGRPL